MTANGLMDHCAIIRPGEAKPGDLIFFQGTYNTSGASHVGIYVGNGMMIHCGNPISYDVRKGSGNRQGAVTQALFFSIPQECVAITK